MLLTALFAPLFSFGQKPVAGEQHLFTPPKQYDASFTAEKLKIDGLADEAAWQNAKWSEDFVDIEGEARPKPALRTRMKMLWGDSCLYIFAELEEPHIWAKLKKHDAIIYHDNDFEVFIDPYNTTHNYYEVEVNALNTIFDLFLPKPYRNGGDALIGYDVQGLRSAVQVNGTINNPGSEDKSWTVEMALPYTAFLKGVEPKKPNAGDFWRINFSRVEWDVDFATDRYEKKTGKNSKPLPEHNWVWSPQGAINMHMPERWGYVYFSDEKTTAKKTSYQTERDRLWLAYYRQKDWQKKHGRYAFSAAELGFPAGVLQIETTKNQFLISVKTNDQHTISMNQDGYISLTK
ncbi:MAG: carbohydrate-binding family 9-like protein [Mucilaginibacter polytrichastri]|nr:carbohydrate-binding family 9-like protein [Mucilaginibacter polytrichastri]